jgi:hypothetical protein
MTDEQLEKVAGLLPLVKAWVDAVELELEARIKNGVEFSTCVLVSKQTRRNWTPDVQILPILKSFGDIDKVAPRVPLSPSQAQKILGAAAMRELSQYVVSVPTTPSLAYRNSSDTAIFNLDYE